MPHKKHVLCQPTEEVCEVQEAPVAQGLLSGRTSEAPPKKVLPKHFPASVYVQEWTDALDTALIQQVCVAWKVFAVRSSRHQVI